jgi:hypothetical protein
VNWAGRERSAGWRFPLVVPPVLKKGVTRAQVSFKDLDLTTLAAGKTFSAGRTGKKTKTKLLKKP